MDIHEAITHLKTLGDVSIGKGPAHEDGDLAVQAEIDDFFRRFPLLSQDRSFVDFLENYSAAAVIMPNDSLIIEIYGFSPDITLHLLYPEENLIDFNGFLRFAEIIVQPGPKGERSISSVYAMDTTGKRSRGIYSSTSVWSEGVQKPQYRLKYFSFLDWLSEIINAQGRLPLVEYNIENNQRL